MSQTDSDLTEAAAKLTEAFNEGDWRTLRSFLADDATYAETGTGRRVAGADAYIELLRDWKEAIPDARGVIRHAIASGDTAAQQLSWEGTHTGPLQTPAGPVPASGAKINVDASLWIRFEDGQASDVRHYLDVLSLLQQVGALPSRPA